jgi:hypothetical protein
MDITPDERAAGRPTCVDAMPVGDGRPGGGTPFRPEFIRRLQSEQDA